MSFSKCKEVIEEGDTVILYIGVQQIYALEVKPKVVNKIGQSVDNVFQTRYGSLKVMNLIGVKYGSKVSLSKGWAHVLYPTPELWTVTLPHRTQILYTPDISMVVTQLEIGPGSVVCEAGTGSGSLSHALLRAIGPTGKLYTCDFHKERAQVALDEFTRHGFGERVDVSHRDVYVEGLGVEGMADAVFLDLPKPWEALSHAVSALKSSGGRICSFSPCIEQVCRTCELMASMGLQEIKTLECLAREFQVKSISLPVISKSKQEAENSKKKGLQEEPQEPNKKIKIEEQSPDEMKLVEENCKRNDSEMEIKPENPSDNARQPKNNDFRIKTGVTPLKMPGHTGFLTFATVPPGLKPVSLLPKILGQEDGRETLWDGGRHGDLVGLSVEDGRETLWDGGWHGDLVGLSVEYGRETLWDGGRYGDLVGLRMARRPCGTESGGQHGEAPGGPPECP